MERLITLNTIMKDLKKFLVGLYRKTFTGVIISLTQ
jgi:hypothetical protein